MTLRDGLAKSRNTITAQLMMQIGPSRVASLARAMGVRQSKLDEVPSLALGTSPVTLKEMVTAFSTIANGGSYIEPHIVVSIEDRNHQVLDRFGGPASEQAMSSQAAQTLLDVMRGTIDYGTAAGLRPRFGLAGDLAGKTGTTQDNTDGWFILMHPQLVAGAWVGFNDNRVTMRSSYWGQGAHNALFVVGDMMQQAQRAGLVDGKATFAAPHLRDQEKPLINRMGDWWNSVFNTGPSDSSVAALPPVQVPEVKLEPPVLEPPPRQPDVVVLPPVVPPPDAPVIASEPQRVPSYPRPLEPTRPVETVPGTQVYRSPEATARMPDPTLPPDVVRPPGQVVRVLPPPPAATRESSSGATAAMGAAPTIPRETREAPRDIVVPAPAPAPESAPAPASGSVGDASGSPSSPGGGV